MRLPTIADRRVGTWCITTLLFAALPGAVAAQGAGEALSLGEAAERALSRNPHLQAGAYRSRAAEARLKEAGQRPPFVLGGELEDVAGSGEFRGTRSAQSTLSLSKVIELGGKRDARVDAAGGEWALMGVEQEARRLDLLAAVARRFVHVAADQARLELARRATELARRTESIVAERVAAARAPVTERNRAAVALARARIEEEHAEHELETSRLRLAVSWGDTEPDFVRVEGALLDLPEVADFQTLRGRLDANPDLERFATERRQREARLRLAEAQRRPDIRVGAGLTRQESLDAQALRFSVSIPLGTGKRAEPGIGAAGAELEQLELNADAARLELHALLFALYQELRHARTEVEVLRDEVMPRVKETLARTEAGFRAGRFSFLELTVAQAERLAAERDILRASRDYHERLIELERLTGSAVAQ